MARQVNKLSARTVATLTKPGRHSDGGDLYLVVERSGSRRWAFLFRQNGRLREMGLGGLNSVPLAMAREVAADCRRTLAGGGDPIAARKGASISTPTFGAFADHFLEAKGPGWRNEKHRAQWKMTLDVYAAPMRRKPTDTISTEDVLGVLKPIWRNRKRPPGSGAGSRQFSTPRAPRDTGQAKTRLGGRVISRSCSASARSSRAAITRPSLMPKSPILSHAFMSKLSSRRWPSNSRS
jgi:Arm DNA-binding domain